MAAFAVFVLVWSIAVFAATGRVCSAAACAAPGRASSAIYAVPGHICVCVCICTGPGGVCPEAACASPGRICSTAVCAVPEDGIQQLVVHLDCLSTIASAAAPRHVCLPELLFASEVSVDYIL